jgi:hypothetical protein
MLLLLRRKTMLTRSNINSNRLNLTYFLKGLRTFISLALLTLFVSISPFLSRTAVAEEWWVGIAKNLFIEIAKESAREYIRTEFPAKQSEPFDRHMSNYIAGRRVSYSNDTDQYSGAVKGSWVQNNGDTSKSGAAGEISWNDGIVSTVLFLNNQRVRIWSGGKEYGGRWLTKDNVLYVQTDLGALYRFYK